MSDPSASDTLPTLLAPGVRVGAFRVERLLGTGGMGEVYLARDTALGRRVALKLLHPDALGSREAVERFLREARTTARFSHPHIVTIYGVGDHEGRPYLALEYLQGQTLRERMTPASPAMPEALRIVHAVAEALAEAHQHQVLHRDLKPENVIIGDDGRVRVLDFGLAKQLDVDGLPGSVPTGSVPTGSVPTGSVPTGSVPPGSVPPGSVPSGPGAPAGREETPPPGSGETSETFETRGAVGGTPAYMAPEQWTGAPCTPATDVWAVGLLLFELLAGRPPLRTPSNVQLAFQVTSDEPMPPLEGQVPGELRELVATEFGDHHALDLGVYGRTYCELLRAVWQDVPVRWEDGRPLRGDPPADHACAP